MAHFIETFIDINVKQPMQLLGLAITQETMLDFAIEQAKGASGILKTEWLAAIDVLKNELKNQ